MISENFESIRSSNEEEYRRTAQAMREIYDQTTGDGQQMLDQAAQRLPRSSKGLKRMATEMSQELDATRPSCARASWSCRRKPRKARPRCGA
jgi:hypothetical protein